MPPRSSLAFGLAAALALAAPVPARCQDDPAPRADWSRVPDATVLTVAGGVSLGAWEAGFLQASIGVLRANPGGTELRLVTGASAGAVNGLMAVLEAYRAAPDPSGRSPFELWIELGIDQLFVPGEAGRQGVFSRRWTERLWSRIEAGLAAGLREDCDVVLGVSATRLVPREVTITPGVTVPRVDEHFTLRIVGRGPGRTPLVTNYVDPDRDQEQLLLPEVGPAREVPLESLRDLLFASAAFPVAFPPQPLRHCVRRPEGGTRLTCPDAEATPALFVDGGVLDNSPVPLAARLAGTGMRYDAEGRVRWLPRPHLGEWLPPRRATFHFVSPEVAAYPDREEREPVTGDTPMLRLAGQLGDALFATARAKNLTALVEAQPELAMLLSVPRRHYPAAGEPMAAFLGFFERELRRFDYALGRYEAGRSFDERERTLALERGAPVRIARPAADPADPGERRLACVTAALEERPDAAARCAGPALREVRILAQATLFRLWDACAPRAGEASAPSEHPQCERARRGEAPPLVPGVEGAAQVAWRRAEGEAELEHVTRVLGALRFWWRDLGLVQDDGEEALGELRRVTGQVAEVLAEAQPREDRFLVGTLGGLAANALAYAPPRHRAWLTVGRQVEVGYSLGILPLRRRFPARPHLALQVQGSYVELGSHRSPGAVGVLAGLELQPARLSGGQLQWSLLVRGGALLAEQDGWGSRRCDTTATDPASCTRPVLQASLVLTAFERVRVNLQGEWYPAVELPQAWAVAPGFGVQLNF